MSTGQKISAVLGVIAIAALSGYLGYDCYGGQWEHRHARVTSKHFVPDRSHWETTIRCSSSNGQTTCNPSTNYVSVPAEYHVLCAIDGDDYGDFDDAWAFAKAENGSRVTIIARIGGMTGIRWLPHIDHEAPVISPRDL